MDFDPTTDDPAQQARPAIAEFVGLCHRFSHRLSRGPGCGRWPVDWPGEMEAVARLYLLRNFSFVPLAYVGNKLLLCSHSCHETYLKAMRTSVKAALAAGIVA